MQKERRLWKLLLLLCAVPLAIGLIIALSTFYVIHATVKKECVKAQAIYKKDCVDALIELIQSGEPSFREKNSAIWALGQMADKRALPLLKSLYTGNVQSNESLDTAISQYELEKAIRWCEKGNDTRWMYQNRDAWH